MSSAPSTGYSVLKRSKAWESATTKKLVADPLDVGKAIVKSMTHFESLQESDDVWDILLCCSREKKGESVDDTVRRRVHGFFKNLAGETTADTISPVASKLKGEASRLKEATMAAVLQFIYDSVKPGGIYTHDPCTSEEAYYRGLILGGCGPLIAFEGGAVRSGAMYQILIDNISDPRDPGWTGVNACASPVVELALDSVLKFVVWKPPEEEARKKFEAVQLLWTGDGLAKLADIKTPEDAKALFNVDRASSDGHWKTWAAPHWQAILWMAPKKGDAIPGDELWQTYVNASTLMLNAVFAFAKSLGLLNLPAAFLGGPLLRMFPAKYLDVWLDLFDDLITLDERGTNGGWKKASVAQHERVLVASISWAVDQKMGEEQRAASERIASLFSRYIHRTCAMSRRGDGLWDSLRIRALLELRRHAASKRKSHLAAAFPVVRRQISDENPGVVRAAIRALGALNNWTECIEGVVDAAVDFGHNERSITELAGALRFIAGEVPGGADEVADAVSKICDDSRVLGIERHQRAAEKLLMQVGGNRANRLLTRKGQLGENYQAMVKTAGDRIQALFDQSLKDAQTGFAVALIMDVVLFSIGLLLLLVATGMGIYYGIAGGSGGLGQQGWVGTIVSGGTGVGSVTAALVQAPREQVKRAVDHMMQIKVVFLGYVRSLGQVDQAFTRRLLEDEPLSSADVTAYGKEVEAVMRQAMHHMTSVSKLKATGNIPSNEGEDLTSRTTIPAPPAQTAQTGAVASASVASGLKVAPQPMVAVDLDDGNDVKKFQHGLRDLQLRLEACGKDLDAAASAVVQAGESPFAVLASMLQTVEAAFDSARQRLRLAVGCAAAHSYSGGARAGAAISPVSDAVLARLAPSGFEPFESYGRAPALAGATLVNI